MFYNIYFFTLKLYNLNEMCWINLMLYVIANYVCTCLAFMFWKMSGSMDLPALKVSSKEVSEFEKRQFFSFPSAVKRMRLQVLQNGLVTELMTEKLPM